MVGKPRAQPQCTAQVFRTQADRLYSVYIMSDSIGLPDHIPAPFTCVIEVRVRVKRRVSVGLV